MVVKTTLSLHVPSTHLLVSIHDIFFSGSVTIFYSYVLYLSHGTNENQSLRLFIHALETVCASEIFLMILTTQISTWSATGSLLRFFFDFELRMAHGAYN